MLKLRHLSSLEEKIEILRAFDPTKQTWVVPDLVSKQSLQQRLLVDRKFIADTACLRASDLWRKILFLTRPEVQVISKNLAKNLIQEWLSTSEFEWAKKSGSADMMMNYLSDLMPALNHPDGQGLMSDWFQQNQSAMVRWGLWYLEAQRVWSLFLEKKIICKDWISGYLVNESLPAEMFKHSIVFDLGYQILPSEVELIKNISRYQDVLVLIPNPSWSEEYDKLKSLYSPLAVDEGKIEAKVIDGIRPKFKVFPSFLGEVKDAVAQVRKWLDSGVEAKKIAILATNKKIYSTCINEFLKQEGIPLRESRADSLVSNGYIAQWLARLNNYILQSDSGSLELDMFYGDKSLMQPIGYDEFRALYSNLYDKKDLARNKEVAKKYKSDISSESRLSRDDFISQVVKFWDFNWQHEYLEGVLHKFFQETPAWTNFSVFMWLKYLTEISISVEAEKFARNEEGVLVESILNSEYLDVTHVYILGVCSSLSKSTQRSAIGDADTQSLSRVTGLNLSSTAQDSIEFQIRWVSDAPHVDAIISYGRTNFSGSSEAPIPFWVQSRLLQNQDIKINDLAGVTRWDELQTIADSNRDSFIEGTRLYDAEKLFSRIQVDLGESQQNYQTFGGEFKLSPSSIGNYKQCPFVYWMANLLQLSTEDAIDLDPSFKDISNLLHGALDEFGKNGFPSTLTDSEIDKIIDDQVVKQKLSIADFELWHQQKKSIRQYFRIFLATESEWRKKFPQTQTIGSEVKFEAFVDLVKKVISREKSPEGILLSGRIDRVDTDGEGNAVVIDYKRSAAGLSSYNSWLENHLFQPLIYSLAIENGFTKLGRLNVVSGQYYSLKDGDRSKAFYIKEGAGTLFDLSSAARNKISIKDKEELLKKMSDLVFDVVENIKAGKFYPSPANPDKDCVECRWRNQCRSPHLL